MRSPAQWPGCAGANERATREAWLRADAEHQTAWRYVEDISRGFELLRGMPEARQAADALHKASNRLQSRRRLLIGAGVAATGALLGCWRQGLLPASVMALGSDYRIGTGEQRDLTLADGTRVWFNTGSASTSSSTTASAWSSWCLARSSSRPPGTPRAPSSSGSAHGRMQALGMRFNVLLAGSRTCLAVFEGAAEIRTKHGG